MISYIKQTINDEHNIKPSYPSMNVLHYLENLYAVVLPSASGVNTQRDISAILKPSEITRSPVNQ